MTPEEMSKWLETAELQSRDLDVQHEEKDTPVGSVRLTRKADLYTETMWVQGYPQVRLIVVTIPSIRYVFKAMPVEMAGVVREIPIGWRDMASSEVFGRALEAVVLSYVKDGWVCDEV